MTIDIQLVHEPIAGKIPAPSSIGRFGAWLEFRGVVRNDEGGQEISALEYEAYPEMAERQIRQILGSLATNFPCLAAKVIHRLGIIPVGDTAIYVGVAAAHRREAIALLAEFMNRLKRDVPIWKRRALPAMAGNLNFQPSRLRPSAGSPGRPQSPLSLDEALREIGSHGQALPAIPLPLEQCTGRVLRDNVVAPGDSPDGDRSTRDGYAILLNDQSESFTIIDTLHAADWKPRRLKTGETFRVATGTALPCGNLRVVMQEHVERHADHIRIKKHETALNIRRRGEEMKAGQLLLPAGVRLDAGKLALLASVGCTRPLVGPPLRVIHFTTGDEIIPPDRAPNPGQVRDSNSILIRSFLQRFHGDVAHHHLPEHFEEAKRLISTIDPQPVTFNLLLISGGASVGDKDFTRPLLEWLGFDTVFSQVNVRPGRPLIFGVNENRLAFGLPGNPLSHFACFHLFVATALAKLVGEEPPGFLRGRLASALDDAPNARETLWPARLDLAGLHPLPWASSGDLTCLTQANALIRVPAECGSIEAGKDVEFWPA